MSSTKRPAWWPTEESKRHADAGCAHPDECKIDQPTTTATARQDALTAATVPYALTGLGAHILDHELPAPLSIDIPGRGTAPITVWVAPGDVEVWTTSGFLAVAPVTREDSLIGGYRHTAVGILDGSALRVRIMWHTDAEPVQS